MTDKKTQCKSLKTQAYQHYQANRLHQAGALYHQACQLDPGDADAWYMVCYICLLIQNLRGAEAAARQAIAIRPNHIDAHTVLGAALTAQHRYSQATPVLEQAIRLNKNNPAAYASLGSTQLELGNPAAAMTCYRKAGKLERNPRYHSNLLLTFNYFDNDDPLKIYEEHLCWGRLFAGPEQKNRDYPNSCEPDRPLRIGYVSADLRNHPVAYFLEPLLSERDQEAFHVTCYANVAAPDQLTGYLQQRADNWHNIFGMPDPQVAQQIRNDRIDILVDLAGHTAGNRLQLFTLRPAPVQVTYLGYPNTTGLAAMDYRLTDARADLPGETEQFYSEELVRLPGGFLCYRPPGDAPPVGPPPCEKNGYITFGSFNNLAKMTPEVIATWAAILQQLPGSRLLLKTRAFVDPGARERYRIQFDAAGIEPDRVELREPAGTIGEHLIMYGDIDIALDTFPYNGTTTTCEALWMGVPVIALAGKQHAGRVGVSLLSQVERTAWIAYSPDDYIKRAVNLARDLQDKPVPRGPLRSTVAASALCGAAEFTRTVELVYHEMWEAWCLSRAM